MENFNYVCFECRTCNRTGGCCHECGRNTYCLKQRWLNKVPKKRDIRGWNQLRRNFFSNRRKWETKVYMIRLRKRYEK